MDVKTALFADPNAERPIPVWIIASAGLLALVTIVSIAGARLTGIGLSHARVPVVEASRDLTFSQHDGTVVVHDADSGALVATVPSGGSSFVSESLKGLASNRVGKSVDPGAPYRVVKEAGGPFWLIDLGTGARIDLRAFGATNAEAFGRFLNHGKG